MKCIEYANQLIKDDWKIVGREGNKLTLFKNNQQKIIIDLRFDTSIKMVGNGWGSTWTNSSNITTNDGAYAYITLFGGKTSGVLIGYNCGFSIPTGATINGIIVNIERHASAAGSISFGLGEPVKLGFWNGSTFTGKGTGKGDSTFWQTYDEVTTFGSSSDLWGTTWTIDDINNSQFGLEMVCTNGSFLSRAAYVDYIEITITYTPVATFVPQIIIF